MVAPPARGPGQDTFVILSARLHQFARGRPPLIAVRWPRATGLASYLSGCLWLIGQRFLFLNRRRFGRVWASPASARIPSRFERSLCSAFRRLSLGGPARGAARVVRPCWWAVATACPEGNCHSPRPETSLDYLTRLRAASHRSWPPNSCFAGTGDARDDVVQKLSGFPEFRGIHWPPSRRSRRGRFAEPQIRSFADSG
jgi:hypothetical protein